MLGAIECGWLAIHIDATNETSETRAPLHGRDEAVLHSTMQVSVSAASLCVWGLSTITAPHESFQLCLFLDLPH